MHANAERVVQAAAGAGLAVEVVEFPDGTRTAEQAAASVGCEVGRIVKSLVFTAGGEPVLALVAGDHRLDETRLAAQTGAAVGRADADLVRDATGYPIGGVPPFGHRRALPTFVDGSLLAHRTVWAAAGTPRHVFEITTADLVRITDAVVADLHQR